MSQDDDAPEKPRIDPEDNPRLAKALAKLSENLKEGEDPLYYDWRKTEPSTTPAGTASDGAEAAQVYVPAKTLPPHHAHKTIEMDRVKINPALDPRQAKTMPRLRAMPDAELVADTAPRPAPIEEPPAGAHAAAAPQAEPPASPAPPRTVGGRTERLAAGVVPPSEEPPPATRAPSSRPPAAATDDRTLGGRTARLKVAADGALPIDEPSDGGPASPWSSDGQPGVDPRALPSSLAPAPTPAPSTASGGSRVWIAALVAAAALVGVIVALRGMRGTKEEAAPGAPTSTSRPAVTAPPAATPPAPAATEAPAASVAPAAQPVPSAPSAPTPSTTAPPAPTAKAGPAAPPPTTSAKKPPASALPPAAKPTATPPEIF